MSDDLPPTQKGPPPLPQPASAAQPFAPAPSVASSAQLTELAKLVNRKLDDHGDRLDVFHQELSMLRQAVVSNADTVPSPSPKSLPGVLAGHAWTGAQVLLIATGAVGFAMQIAAVFKPSLVSPLQHAQEFLRALGGG